MASALRNVIALTGLELPQALAMAAGSPAAFLGLAHERGALGPGKRADWVWLDAALRVRGTWIGSRQVAPPLPETPAGTAAGG